MQKLICLAVALFASVSPSAHVQSENEHSHVRTYYIAADEIDWDYAPVHVDQTNAHRYGANANAVSGAGNEDFGPIVHLPSLTVTILGR